MKAGAASIDSRVATVDEVELLIQWAADEGWNPGIDDATLFHAVDPTGFIVSFANDELIAGVSVVKHTDHHSFLGLYLCKPGFRGQGIGMATWNVGLASIGNRSIGLDGVVDQQDNYRKSGFVYHFANKRYSGVLNVGALPELDSRYKTDIQIRFAVDDNFDEEVVAQLVAYDAGIGGLKRPRFFGAWMKPCQSRYTFTAVHKQRVVGLVGVRACLEGYKIGPLLADTDGIAAQLLKVASDVTANNSVMLDVPESNRAAVILAENSGLESVFETARMYKGQAPLIDTSRLFGVATLELG